MTPIDPTRRRVLQTLVGAGAASVLASCDKGDKGGGDTDTTDTTDADIDLADPVAVRRRAIETVVIVMMENRSFDHYFGALTLEEGRTDVDGLTAEMTNPDLDGNDIAPFRLSHECLEDPPHGWSSSRRQFNEGACDGFVTEHVDGRSDVAKEAMGYHNREDLPVFYALADDNALCDRWFASVMGPTQPNRWFAMAADSAGRQSNDVFPLMPSPSIMGQLTEAGVDWCVYFTDAPSAALVADSGGVSEERFKPIEDFLADAEAGTLPSVCFVEPGYTLNDDHPPHPPLLGQLFVGTVYKALADSPQYDRSLFIVDYDEHGGFYDHVAPPKVEGEARVADGFDQLGFRIPGIVAGPWAKAEVVHTQYEHVSVLSTIQELFDLPFLNERNEKSAPLWDCLDHDAMVALDPAPPTELPTMDVSPDDYGDDCNYFLVNPGQPELDEALDRGWIPKALDRRDVAARTLDHLLLKAEKFGLLRWTVDGMK